MFRRSAFAVALVGAAFSTSGASAAVLAGTLTAQFFEVVSGTDPDFNIYSTPAVANGSGLGPNGLPIATGGINDIAPTGEITWWSPMLNANVSATGSTVVPLPFASNMFAPNATGSNNSSFFQTAILSGSFTLLSASTVAFELGSDDDSFIYVDGVLFGQNPGVHAVTNVSFTSPTLSAGAHTIQVFYADRQQTGAYLSLRLLSEDIVVSPPLPAVPEPMTWALMLTGFAAMGGVMRRRVPRVAMR